MPMLAHKPIAETTAQLFHALSDPTRLRIVALLRHGERCVCDLTGALEAAQSRLSFHLKVLKDAGLVADARATGVTDLYLLTTTAEAYCAARGFSATSRDAVPDEVSASAELRGACPASATVMHRVL